MQDSRPTDWLTTATGRQLLAAEAEMLGSMLDDVFGLELLQLGSWGAARELLSASRIRRQTVIADTRQQDVDVVASLCALPIQTASIDAVLLPHTLEFESDPHSIVREADRVLGGEGQMLGARRVRDWLGLLGYEVVMQRHYLYSLPWGDDSNRPRRMLRRGLFNPLPAAAWLMKARKHVYRLTPLRHRFFRERRPVFGTSPAPTARNRP
jgi:hypothetical protein